MRCPRCASENREGQRFCGNGCTQLAPAPEPQPATTLARPPTIERRLAVVAFPSFRRVS